MPHNIRITRIISRTESVAYQLHGLQFSKFSPPAGGWQPQVNAFSFSDRYELCVELAGIDKEVIDLKVEGN
jgi:HSP20 family molecular chaperone IbpA